MVSVDVFRLQEPGEHVFGGAELAGVLLAFGEGLAFGAGEFGDDHTADVAFVAGVKVNRVGFGGGLLFVAGATREGQCRQGRYKPFGERCGHGSVLRWYQIFRFLNNNRAPTSGVAHQSTRPSQSPPMPMGRSEPRLRTPLSWLRSPKATMLSKR